MMKSKRLLTIILIGLCFSAFAKTQKHYLNAADTTDHQNNLIYAAKALVKQNIQDTSSLRFNALYLTKQDDQNTICGNFHASDFKTATDFIASGDNLLINDGGNKKTFKKTWDQMCE